MKQTILAIATISVGIGLSAIVLHATFNQSFAAEPPKAKGQDNSPSRFLGLPPIACPPDNPVTQEKIALGRKLFFDKALSSDSTRSCATCHVPFIGFADSDTFS